MPKVSRESASRIQEQLQIVSDTMMRNMQEMQQAAD